MKTKTKNGGEPKTQNIREEMKEKKTMNIIEQHQKYKKETEEVKPFVEYLVSPTGVRNRGKC